MINTIIIDDEKDARLNTIYTINTYCANINIVDTAESVAEGIEKIKMHNPDLVLLDVDMPDGTGFDLLRKLMPVSFMVIFITAYSEYAIKAIKFNALDFLVKPLDPEDFLLAVSKVINNHNEKIRIQKLENLLTEINTPKKLRIALGTFESVYFVEPKQIIRIEANANYSIFFINNGKRIMVSKPLKEYVEMLENHGFFRSHQSHFINLQYLKEYKKQDGGYVVLTNSDIIPLSARKKEKLIKAYKNFT